MSKSYKHRTILTIVSFLALSLASCGINSNEDDSTSSDSSTSIVPTPSDNTPNDNTPVEPVIPADPDYTYHAVGGWGLWEARSWNKMIPTTVETIKKIDNNLGTRLQSKPIKYLYFLNITITEVDVDYEFPALVNQEYTMLNGKYAIKALGCTWDKDESEYDNYQWITNPGVEPLPANAEALTDNIFMPPYQAEHDPYGFTWANNPMITSGEGNYTFILAIYTVASTITTFGYAFALVPGHYKGASHTSI